MTDARVQGIGRSGVHFRTVATGIAQRVAEWTASVRYEDLSASVIERARLQAASVTAAVIAGADATANVRRASVRWGSGDDATLIPGGERVPLHTACYVNAAASVAFDFDDYLFAGHTGHSAVLGALAVGETTGASGRDVLAAQVVGNEVGGRLGAAMLLGPHNGQMWTYIHALAGACVAGRLLGLDSGRIGHAIGLALAQPPYPLAPAFFGPDSKALMASGPLVEGVRAAELAAEGVTGADDILGDPAGFLARVGARPLALAFTGFGSAWVTESLTYKLYPGCAYVDAPVDAFGEILEAFRAKTGRDLMAGDVGTIAVESTIFTDGMERMGAPSRRDDRIRATDVNFSVALSLGVLIACGRIASGTLSPPSLERNRDAILRVADRVSVASTDEMNARVGGLGDVGIDTARIADPDTTLDGADFSRFRMRFPARVTLETTAGERFSAEVEIPAGAAGRPLAETAEGVRGKFLGAARGVLADPEAALARVLTLDQAADARAVVRALCAR